MDWFFSGKYGTPQIERGPGFGMSGYAELMIGLFFHLDFLLRGILSNEDLYIGFCLVTRLLIRYPRRVIFIRRSLFLRVYFRIAY